MATVHAYRRTAAIEVDLAGEKVKFKPNGEGHVVADVSGDALERLLAIPEAYRVHGADAAPADDDEPDASPFVITNGDETVDLRTLTDEQLHAFAAENDVKVSPKAKGDTIRNKIVEALNSVE